MMKDVEDMTHEYAIECLGSMYQVLNEVLIPYTLNRRFGDEFKDFDSSTALDCLEDEVVSVCRTVELYDALVTNPVLFLSDYQLEHLLSEFSLFIKGFADGNLDGSDFNPDEISDDEKSIIEQFICEKMRG